MDNHHQLRFLWRPADADVPCVPHCPGAPQQVSCALDIHLTTFHQHQATTTRELSALVVVVEVVLLGCSGHPGIAPQEDPEQGPAQQRVMVIPVKCDGCDHLLALARGTELLLPARRVVPSSGSRQQAGPRPAPGRQRLSWWLRVPACRSSLSGVGWRAVGLAATANRQLRAEPAVKPLS
jgi:hypothetical protein